MTERPSDADPHAMRRDRSALYAQAQIRGTRYWQFSASHQQARGQFGHLPSSSLPVGVPEQTQDLRVPVNRWYALRSVFAPIEPAPEGDIRSAQRPAQPSSPPPPIIAVLSVAGGVGKTCLVATLGRALSGVGEQVLLVDISACGLLPFYYASREVKPGVMRTFSAPLQSGRRDAPVRVLSLEAERFSGDGGEQDPLLGTLVRDGRTASRLLVDVGTANRELIVRLLRLRPTVLVPILPDMSSLAWLNTLDALLGGAAETFYLLNQFDASLALHVDVRGMLEQQLGGRLLPFVLHRSPAVSEALAEGMTVIDYAPASGTAEDYRQLAGWLRNFAAPAELSYGDVRWTER